MNRFSYNSMTIEYLLCISFMFTLVIILLLLEHFKNSIIIKVSRVEEPDQNLILFILTFLCYFRLLIKSESSQNGHLTQRILYHRYFFIVLIYSLLVFHSFFSLVKIRKLYNIIYIYIYVYKYT